MLVKQISVFVENRKGKLAGILSVLRDKKIDIRALSVADTTDFGILRLIVSDPDGAYQALKEAGCTVSATRVLAVGVSDQPGGLAAITQLMADYDLSVEYVYAFITRTKNEAYVILKVTDAERAMEIFQKQGIHMLTEKEIYGI